VHFVILPGGRAGLLEPEKEKHFTTMIILYIVDVSPTEGETKDDSSSSDRFIL
jgi:hypothetical protein